MNYDEIKLGQKTEYVRTITKHDIELFAEVSGDLNPVHTLLFVHRSGKSCAYRWNPLCPLNV